MAVPVSTALIRRTVSLILLAASAQAAHADATPEAGGAELETVVIDSKAYRAAGLATAVSPSQVSVDSVAPVSIVSDSFIRNFTSPVADYVQVVGMTPGAFGFSANGAGLGDTKVTIRGLNDGNFNITFDNIPFSDTNGTSHHSWGFFPSQFIGGAVVDRSPGTAGSIGQATYGGSIDLRSRILSAEESRSVTVSDGTWNTRLVNLEYQSGDFGSDKDQRLMFNIHRLLSDGYQTYNSLGRTAGSFKYQAALAPSTQLTLYYDYQALTSNAPSVKGVSRTNYLLGNYTALLSGDPTKGNFYGFNFYNVPTSFGYAQITTELGGWTVDNKAYRYSYHNKQNYNNSLTVISATSAVDKLNSYQTAGDLLRLSRDFGRDTVRMGLWVDVANSYRYQIKADPRTYVDVAVPNFSEKYTTRTVQPYAENEFKFTDQLSALVGIKYSNYNQSFVHLQDNGGAVGPLGGIFSSATNTVTGGLPSISNKVTYSDWLPSVSLHYLLTPNWSTYAQYVYGDSIPSTSIFDVKNAQPLNTPKPQLAKVAQLGTVWASPQFMAALDVYHMRLDSPWVAGPVDPATGEATWTPGISETSKGIEGELSYVVGGGLSVYANATIASVKLASGLWLAGAPKDTEKLGVTYTNQGLSTSVQVERIGDTYGAGQATQNDFLISPIVVTNAFLNYTFLEGMWKVQGSVSNLFDKHNILGVASAVTGSKTANPLGGDLLTILPARSLNVTVTVKF